MARRRRVEAPSAEDLSRMAAEVAETAPRRAPPIAQVAGEAAAAYSPETEVDRTEAARNRADAERLRQAEAEGLVISEIPLAEIDPDDMVRDRARVDEEDLRELRDSILKNGLRLPIEVYELAEPRNGRRYGVLSGYRRLLAMQQIYDYTELPRYGAIRALVRTPASVPDAFVAMVEENEIRASLSAYERGRIAVVATQSGAFNGVEAAVDALFATASKAKRSKVRSFAAIFEDLGDLLRFPEALTERQGLRLASALRAGHHEALRDLLDERRAATPEEEWETVQPIIDEVEQGPRPVRRGGRPRSAGRAKPVDDENTMRLTGDVVLRRSRDGDAWVIRLEGARLDEAAVHSVMVAARNVLDRSG